MKKIILMTILALFFAAPVMAATLNVGAGGDVVTGANDKEATLTIATLSNNVYGDIVASEGAFASVTKHINGSKNYATSSESTKIFWENVADDNDGTATFEITLQNSDTTDFSSWDAL